MAEAQKCFDEGNADKPGGTKMISLPVVKEKEPVTKQPDETFLIDTNLIPKSSLQDHEMGELAGLGLNIFNQDEFEQGVMNQVGQALAEEEEKRIRKILEKELKGVEEDIKQTKVDLVHIVKMVAQWSKGDTNSPEVRRRLETVHKSKDVKLKQIKKLVSRKKVLEAKLCGVDLDSSDEDDGGISSILKKEAVAVESEQERMIRQGEMTPFGTVITQSTSKQSKLPTNSELKVPDKDPEEKIKKEDLKEYLLNKLKSKKSTKRPSQTETTNEVTAEKRTRHNEDMPSTSNDNIDPGQADRRRHILPIGVTADDIKEEEEEEEGEIIEDQNDEDYIPDSDEECSLEKTKEKKTAKHIKKIPKPKSTIIRKSKDDGDIKYFDRRIRDFQKEELARQNNTDSDDEDEEFEGGLAVPGRIWSKLFNYQRIGVRWLWELHGQEAGGIVGDEMGLGKTIQTIAFLAALRQSKLRNKQFRHAGLGPCIIVCPTTVMHQWVKEFHKWWPLFRVAVLHSSGCHVGKVIDLIRGIVKDNGILITSYNTLVGCKDDLLPYNWHYVILDEGHKIRNPDAQATLVCKQFRTPHRIILSGSPIQNNLKELWSLFDFIFPGKLGTLPDFMQHFSVPIVQGGYANATQVQVETAFRCASILRDTINPFLLRRMKADVKINLGLPDKTEQVLFCRLTDEQHDVYKQYLTSRECENILAGKFQIFAGLITLRKICNHPDISTGGPRVFDVTQYDNDDSLHYGYHKRSGKMIVVEALLKLWKQQGHKVLLFSQSTKMLDILESFVQKQDYNYLRMDGTTSIGGRQPLVLKFNKDPSIFVFLLTTRVGGLGVNLTGANRVIIFDPDWNPSTDTQARERAWRIGQQKSVTIYRLLTSGTIEEKIYHRQIFKQFLSNRVLKDPKQRRLFKSSDIYELFTLGSKDNEEGTETSAIFAGTGSDVKLKKNSKNIFDEIKDKKEAEETSVSVEDEEVVRMREFARKLSQQMEQNKLKKSNSASNLDDIDSETSAASKPSTSKNKITYADYKRTKLLKSADSDANSKVKESHASSSTSQASSSSSSNHRSHRKEKKKKKDAKVDGERISHLVKQRKYKRSSQEEDETQPSSKQDDFVLQTLFQKGGIHEAMKHDKIMDCGRPDYAIVEAEAEKVAKQAVAALRKSRVNCATATSGVPTWTGQNGGIKPRFGKKKSSVVLNSGATSTSNVDKTSTSSEKHFDGTVSGYVATTSTTPMSSDELLTRMRERKMPSSASAFDSAVESLASKVDPVHTDLLTDIRNFVAFQARNDGQAMTQELLDYFGDRLPPSDSAKFKAMLKQLCHFDKSTGIGIWQLKEEFR